MKDLLKFEGLSVKEVARSKGVSSQSIYIKIRRLKGWRPRILSRRIILENNIIKPGKVVWSQKKIQEILDKYGK